MVRDYVVAEHSPSKVDFIGITSPGRDNGRQQCVHHSGGTGHSHVLPLACLGTICPGHASIKAPDPNYLPLFCACSQTALISSPSFFFYLLVLRAEKKCALLWSGIDRPSLGLWIASRGETISR